MTPAATIRASLANANVRALLLLIRRGESGLTADAYRVINGGAQFSAPPWVHPWPNGTPTTQGGRAAGAYQFLPSTWKRLAEQYPIDCSEFTPDCQDFGAVALIAGRGALDDVLAGRIEWALFKLRSEWTSLPNASESRADWTVERAISFYKEQGGSVATQTSPTPAEAPVAPPARPAGATNLTPRMKEKPMPVFLALLPQLLAAIPSLIGVFGKGSPQATINQKAAEVVTEAVTAAATAATAATQPLNLQAAVEAIQANPQIAQTVSEAVQSNPAIAALIEVGGGIAEARRANMAVVESPNWWRALLTPAFIVSLLLLAGAAAIIADVLYAHPDNWTSNDRSQALILGISIVSGVMGYYIGSSLGSTRKDDILASR